MTPNTRSCAALTSAALAALSLAGPGQAGEMGPIRFAPGKSQATVSGAAVRGDRDLWRLSARKGQRLELSISSLERNAAFELYAPGATASRGEDGWEVKGRSLPGAGEAEDAMRWAGQLRATGAYLLIVGGTRGNAAYRLTARVR